MRILADNGAKQLILQATITDYHLKLLETINLTYPAKTTFNSVHQPTILSWFPFLSGKEHR